MRWNAAANKGGVLSLRSTRICRRSPGLRFFLALWVILHHLTGPGRTWSRWRGNCRTALFSLIRGGYQAVTTFFVLSGFVLTRTYAATVWDRRTLFNYWIGRIRARVSGIPAFARRDGPVRRWRIGRRARWATSRRTYCWCRHGSVRMPGGLEHAGMVALLRDVFLCAFPLSTLLVRRANWRNVIAGRGGCDAA